MTAPLPGAGEARANPDVSGAKARDARGGSAVIRRLFAALHVVPVLKLAIAGVAIWFLARILGSVAWSEVWSALSHLAWWQCVALLAVVLLRQVLNAEPLALFVPGLGTARAVQNDLTAVLVSTFAPPPTDLVLRTAMFTSWQIPMTRGTSGLALNTLMYYVARFAAPVVGIVIALLTAQYTAAYGWTALGSGLVAVALVVGLVAVTRGEGAAAGVGRLAGRLAHRFAPDRVDPDRWSEVLVEFQSRAGEQLRRSGRWAALDLVGLLLVEGLLLVLSLRFVGASAAQVSTAEVLVVFLVSYPLTALPFSGLGVLDSAISAALVAHGQVDPSLVVAALVIWRVCLLLVPMVLGTGCLVLWRHQQRQPAGLEA